MRLTRQPTDLRDESSFDHEGRSGVPSRTIGTLLADLADRDPRVVAASADLTWSTFVAEFMDRHPSRFFQAGVSERNMLGFAAGLAASGYVPYVTTFSAFASLQCLDVIRNDHAYTGLPVRTIGTHCGISMGYYASSHHAIEDLGALRSIPRLTVLSPADLVATEALLGDAHNLSGPVYFRLGRGADGPPVYESVDEVRLGAPSTIVEGTDVLLLTTGIGVHAARDAAQMLAETGDASATVIDLHTIRPFADEAVATAAARHSVVVVVEDHLVDGGIGTSVQQAISESGGVVPVYKHGLHDFAIVGPPSHMYSYYGLDRDGIATVVLRAIEQIDGRKHRAVQGPLWGREDMTAVLRAQRERDAKRTTS